MGDCIGGICEGGISPVSDTKSLTDPAVKITAFVADVGKFRCEITLWSEFIRLSQYGYE